MSDFLGTLCNSKLLRAALKDAELPALELGLEKLTELVEEKRNDEKEKQRQDAKKLEILNNIKSLMHNNNLSISDLNELLNTQTSTPKTIKRNVPAKYRFTDALGQELTWTGQGRTPRVFLECMKREQKGCDDYLIKKDGKN